MSGFISRASEFQYRLVYGKRKRRIAKEQRYRIFLIKYGDTLPSKDKLSKWRFRLIIVSLIPLFISTICCFINYPDLLLYDIFYLSPSLEGITSPIIINGSIFLILISFSVSIDYVILKRFGEHHTIFFKTQQHPLS